MNQRIYVQLAKTGDVCNLLPIAYDDFQHGQRSAIMVSKHYSDLLDGCSYVDKIVFDGDPWDIAKAVTQAQALSSDVKATQVLGPPDIVKEWVFKPAGLEHAVTDNFQKESWMLAGRMDLWKTQPPLVFDQRNSGREAALLPPKSKKKLLLVSVGGNSSPFPAKALLLELVRLKFGKKFQIIDLSTVKAEKFFDLLGLYDEAHCLISTDSGPLHLAYACKNLPVIALINDRPSYWHGSAWRPNHLFHCRYRDWPRRAVEMLDVIGSIGEPGCPFYPRVSSPKVVHVWSQYEVADENLERHLTAKDTWQKEYMRENVVGCPIELGSLGRDSKNRLKDETKQFPYVKDVLALASRRATLEDVIVLTRADTCLNSGAFSTILKSELPLYSHRVIQEEDGFTHHPTCDLFAFTKAWWKAHQAEMPDMILGADFYWHRILMELIRQHGGKEARNLIYRKPSTAVVMPSGETPPRVTYNDDLSRKFLEKHNITFLVPPVSTQVKTISLNRRSMSPFAYNPSLIRFKNKLFMAYRWHREGGAGTTLAMAELDDAWNITNNQAIEINGGSMEDPRLFIFKDELWMSWVESTWPDKQPTSVVWYGKLVEGMPWRVEGRVKLVYGNNDGTGMEKNWGFWQQGDRLFAMYQASHGPIYGQVVLEIENGVVLTWHGSEAPRWAWGPIKSGMTPVPFKGKLLRFFHSALDNESPPWRRRYYMGAALMEPEPPFQTLAISKEPIVRGSEVDELTDIERSSCSHRKQGVIFPMGCIPAPEGWFVSAGINDCCSIILHITVEGDLKL